MLNVTNLLTMVSLENENDSGEVHEKSQVGKRAICVLHGDSQYLATCVRTIVDNCCTSTAIRAGGPYRSLQSATNES